MESTSRRMILAGAAVVALAATTCAARRDRALPPCPTPSPVAAAAGSAVTVVAVGDVADCSGGRQADVAAVVDRIQPAALLALGDLAYPNGSVDDFLDCYGPSFGRFRGITHPVPGNHEYHTPHAGAYYAYFCDAAGAPFEGYHSFELGSWHVVALNSNCGGDLDVPAEVASEFGGCGAGSPQARWLASDLEAHPSRCTLALWHHPLRSSSSEGGTHEMADLFRILVAHGVDLALNGHAHAYERFPPMTADGRRDDARGMRVMIVGTGGSPLSELRDHPEKSDVRDATSHGVLRLELLDGRYSWRFVPVDGDSFHDEGGAPCHG